MSGYPSFGVLLGLRAYSRLPAFASLGWATCLVFLLLFATTVPSSATGGSRLSVVYCEDCVPFEYQDHDGKPAGLVTGRQIGDPVGDGHKAPFPGLGTVGLD